MRDGDLLELDFPAHPPNPLTMPDELAPILGARPFAMFEADARVRGNRFAVFEDAPSVRNLAPDLARLAALPPGAVVATAPGTGEDADVDYVVRSFAPGIGIPEDPVTGAIQTSLAPYWAKRLGRSRMRAR